MGVGSANARARARRSCERGASAVEFALVLPIFIMLLFGVVTTGLAYNDKLSIANAVREGARLGATVDYTGGATSPPYTTAATAWADAVQLRVQQVYFNAGSTLAKSQICVLLETEPGDGHEATPTTQGTTCGTEPATPSGVAPGSCVVKVWVTKPAKISLMVFPDMNIDIGAQSVSFYGRAVGACPTS